MQKKIYVVGMFDDGTAGKVQAAVSAVAGVTLSSELGVLADSLSVAVTNCIASCEKSQVLVDYDDAGAEAAINTAISGCGVDVIG